jgi:hypothetical protein
MRGLKALVIVMGVMLVAGIAALAALVAVRLSHLAPPPVAAFTAPAITLPKGARIEAISTGPDRVTLAILLTDGARELLIVDLRTGRELGTIPLQEAP